MPQALSKAYITLNGCPYMDSPPDSGTENIIITIITAEPHCLRLGYLNLPLSPIQIIFPLDILLQSLTIDHLESLSAIQIR